MSKHRNPDVIRVPRGFERTDANSNPLNDYESGEFFRCYGIIMAMSIHSVQRQLLKLGQWPYERVAVRVLDWEEAVTRLKADVPSMMAMVRMVVAIEDQHGTLYLVRTPDLVSGKRLVHRRLQGGVVQHAVDDAFKN